MPTATRASKRRRIQNGSEATKLKTAIGTNEREKIPNDRGQDGTMAARPTCRFFDLPPEIRNLIYEFAAPQKHYRLYTIWNSREILRSLLGWLYWELELGRTPLCFGTCLVRSPPLPAVNKQFYYESEHQAWMRLFMKSHHVNRPLCKTPDSSIIKISEVMKPRFAGRLGYWRLHCDFEVLFSQASPRDYALWRWYPCPESDMVAQWLEGKLQILLERLLVRFDLKRATSIQVEVGADQVELVPERAELKVPRNQRVQAMKAMRSWFEERLESSYWLYLDLVITQNVPFRPAESVGKRQLSCHTEEYRKSCDTYTIELTPP